MGITLSFLRIRFDRYRFLARSISFTTSELVFLKEEFCDLPGSKLSKLKALHSEVFLQVNWGRLLVFLNFAEQLGLSEEEWGLLFDFLVPTLKQMKE